MIWVWKFSSRKKKRNSKQQIILLWKRVSFKEYIHQASTTNLADLEKGGTGWWSGFLTTTFLPLIFVHEFALRSYVKIVFLRTLIENLINNHKSVTCSQGIFKFLFGFGIKKPYIHFCPWLSLFFILKITYECYYPQ